MGLEWVWGLLQPGFVRWTPPASQNHLTTVFSIKLVHNFELGSQCLMYAAHHRILSLHFNSHFPGKPELASVYWSKGWWRTGGGGDNWTTGAISHAKLQSNHHHQQTNIQFLLQVGCHPVAQPTVSYHCQITDGENPCTCLPQAHLLYLWPLITPGYLGRVAMPLISPLMPVPRLQYIKSI